MKVTTGLADRRAAPLVAAGVLAAGMTVCAPGAEAAPAPVPCSVELAELVTNTLGCQLVLDFIDDTPRPEGANTLGLFGFTDWLLYKTFTGFPGDFPGSLGVIETGCVSEDCLIFDIAGNGVSTTTRNPAIENVLLLFGAPLDATAPGGLVGYLLGPGETENTYAAMFLRDDAPAEIGFLSVYARLGPVTPIPLPTPALLLLSALAGLGILARRRRPA